MISERSSETEDWSNDENSALHHKHIYFFSLKG